MKMKDKIFMLVIGMLIGAILASAGFLVFGNGKGKKKFDSEKFKDGNFTPPSGFSGDFNEIDVNKVNIHLRLN